MRKKLKTGATVYVPEGFALRKPGTWPNVALAGEPGDPLLTFGFASASGQVRFTSLTRREMKRLAAALLKFAGK